MATLQQVREGLATNLSSISGCQVSAYLLSNPTPPALEVYPDPTEGIEYHRAMGNGLATYTMAVRGIVAASTDIGGQKNLDEWLEPSGSSSVKAAIEADRTLGGAVKDAYVRDVTGYQEYVKPGTNTAYYAAVWTVVVLN